MYVGRVGFEPTMTSDFKSERYSNSLPTRSPGGIRTHKVHFLRVADMPILLLGLNTEVAQSIPQSGWIISEHP